MIISYLKGKVCKRNNGLKSDVVFINNSNKKFTGNISFGRCFGIGVLLVTIDIDNFDFRQRRLYPLNCMFLSCHVSVSEWIHTLELPECQGNPCSKQAQNLNFKWLQLDSNPQPLSLVKDMDASCFRLSDSVKNLWHRFGWISLFQTKGNYYSYCDEKHNTYALNVCLEGCDNETIRLWPCSFRLSSPSVHSIYSETENDDSKSLTSYIEKLKQRCLKFQNWLFLSKYKIYCAIGNGRSSMVIFKWIRKR